MSNRVILCPASASTGCAFRYRADLQSEDRRSVSGATQPMAMGPGASLTVDAGAAYLMCLEGVVDVAHTGNVRRLAAGRFMRVSRGHFVTEAA